MLWSNTTTLGGLVQDITFLTGLDTNAVNKKERARLANRWYYKAAILAWKSDPDWQFDDPNISTGQSDQSWTYDATFPGLPRATRNLSDDVRIYRLPTSALAIERVEIKRLDGAFYVLRPIEESKINFNIPNDFEGTSRPAISEFLKTKGLPRFYNLIGSNIELFPAPDTGQVTATAGIKIYVNREIKEFAAEDDSTEPGLPEPFHRILSLGAAYDIAIAKGLDNTKTLKSELDQLFLEMEIYFTSRQRFNKKSIKPQPKSTI